MGVELGGVNWIDMAQLVGTCKHGNETLGSIFAGNFLSS
jgi:hypothetical protein